MTKMLRWGILTTGNISHQFATAFSCLQPADHILVGVAARDPEKAIQFANEFGIAAYNSYEDLLKDTVIDVVYIGSINTEHLPLGKLALDNGKHVLCEKPLCVNVRETRELTQYAKEKGLFLMEGIWSRFFPSYTRLRKEIQNGSIGDVVDVHSSFGVDYLKKNRTMSRELEGGGILDIGVYNVQVALFVIGQNKPKEIKSIGTLTSDALDESNETRLVFHDGKKATLITDTRKELANEVVVFGTRGMLKLKCPFWRSTSLVLANGEVIEFEQLTDKNGTQNKSMGLSYQCHEVKRCIDAGLIESDIMSHSESILIAEIIEEMRKQMGVTYDQDIIGFQFPHSCRKLFFTGIMPANTDFLELPVSIERRFPGPAGLLPKLEKNEMDIIRTQPNHPLSTKFSNIISADLRQQTLKYSDVISKQDLEILKISQAPWKTLVTELGLDRGSVKELLHIMNVEWIKKMVVGNLPISVKIPFLALVVLEGVESHAARAFRVQPKNQSVKMMDVTGTIVAAVDSFLLPYMVPGTALAFQNVRLLTTPKNRSVAIIATKKNVICLTTHVKNHLPAKQDPVHCINLSAFNPEKLLKDCEDIASASLRQFANPGAFQLVENVVSSNNEELED